MYKKFFVVFFQSIFSKFVYGYFWYFFGKSIRSFFFKDSSIETSMNTLKNPSIKPSRWIPCFLFFEISETISKIPSVIYARISSNPSIWPFFKNFLSILPMDSCRNHSNDSSRKFSESFFGNIWNLWRRRFSNYPGNSSKISSSNSSCYSEKKISNYFQSN